MRLSITSLAFFCILYSSLCFASESVLVDDAIRKAVDLPQQAEQDGLFDVLWELRAERGNNTLLVLTHFPQGLGRKIDAALADAAKHDNDDGFHSVQEQADFSLEKYLERLSEALADKGSAPALPERAARDWGNTFAYVTTWQVFRPSATYVTVVFRHDRTGGAAHGIWTYTCLSFHLDTSAPLEFSDVFPDAKSGEKLLRQRVIQSLLAQKKAAGQAAEINEDHFDVNLPRLALTPEGIRVYYAPYEAGSYAEGEFLVDIPKVELLKMGATPALWQDS